MNLRKNVARVLVVGALASTMLLTGCNPKGDGGAATPADSDTLRVGMECDYAPFNWTQTSEENGYKIASGGYAGGYDVEIAKKIAESMDKNLEIVKTEWNGLTPAITSGKIDLIIAGMSPTAERRETLDFSNTYYTSDLVIVVKKDGAYANASSLNDFKGANITGQLNTFHYEVIDQIEGVNKSTALETFPAMIVALRSGKIDGYVSERPGALSAVAANDDLTFVEFAEGKGFETSVDDTSISVGVKKGNTELLEKVNDALSKISEEERQSIMEEAVANQPLGE
ncbi:transporter substrate-binding domain-containing protein [Peptoniphilus phoceensis]|uniref:transporter substrate-binding domain-containing protein n=1 Tax=Peptoniphilus phoceensis TaxID=1720298 RepID=UPI000785DA9D|nr:transporter substrate-binding domain-containing protein [Peptoniphilus phoceensis]